MALEFNRVALDVTGERSLIREKVVMLVNVSSVMPCDMLQAWCFLFGLNRDIGRDRGEHRVSVRCHSGSKPR
ncbi:hypothetical protein HanXRQr2_Chr09g0368911 [Helianthus annuus]|uniref:Uncharacterized protein n=1 Tax=Helianthus annuus TaxID=4232 RepID=A0A9K3N7H3_HELAN|nr:hypothetical protein HanXRQr2_Chr09g0368911 [Helianthus annuus]